MRAVVIINPISGPRRRRSVEACRALATDVFRHHDVEVEVLVTGARGDAHMFAARARHAGVPLVAAWGGDGTINEVASALVFSESCLAIVPGGSGNGLARDLGIPLDCTDALHLAASGSRRLIDAGQIDESWFFNVAGVGLDAQIAQHIAMPGARRGLSGYARITFAELPRYRAQQYTIEHSGTSVTYRALIIAVANSRQYGNGAQIAPAARLDDGHLDLVVVESQPLWRLLAQIPAFFNGGLRAGRGLHMTPVVDAVVRGSGPLAYHVDGELKLGDDDLRITTRPRALYVKATQLVVP
jgi:YegS/Rv2252/BmrU family lipid kinase